MKLLRHLAFIGSILLTNLLTAQDTWSLEKCIAYARENSPTVNQSELQVKNAQLGSKEANYNRYPTLTASSNLGFNFGRTVNPSTNQFESNNSNFNGFNLSTSVLLYNGGRLQQEYRRADVDSKVAGVELEQAAQGLALQVAGAYLQVLLNEEQLENARKRLVQDQNQLDRLDKQIKAGAASQNAKYDIQAQIARSEQQVVAAANNVELSYLNLKNLMQLPPDQNMKLEKPSVVIPTDANPEGVSFKALYNAALATQAQIRAGELRIQSAQIGVKIAQAALMPTLFAQGSLATNYANLIQKVTGFRSIEVQQQVKFNNTPATISVIQNIPELAKKSYGSQLTDNFGQSLGFSLQMPIFDGFSRKINVERAKINVERNNLQLETTKQQLRSDVQNAIASARAMQKTYQAAQRTYDAQKIAFEAAEKRFQVGHRRARFDFGEIRVFIPSENCRIL
jgi:outer membrane protein